ncbi:hypothetical protein GCM10027053_48010 [Intrasporangium mesophilum]
MGDGNFEHVNLRAWPFNVVANHDSAEVWVGRPDALKRIRRLVRGATRVGASQIVFLWASFGSGKTHALRYMQRQAEAEAGLEPLYVVVPRGIKSFKGIYQSIIDEAATSGLLARLGGDLFATVGGDPEDDLSRALVRIFAGGAQARTAQNWLRGEKLPMAELRAVGLGRRLETVADVITVLNDLVALVASRQGHLLLLLDEVQELGELPAKQLAESVGGIHKVFDRNSTGLTVVLAFTTGAKSTVRNIIGETIYDRASETIDLPPLSAEQGLELISGLLSEWAIDRSRAPWPFTEEALVALVAQLDISHTALTPRSLIHAFNSVLRDAEDDIWEGEINEISPEYALAAARAVADGSA